MCHSGKDLPEQTPDIFKGRTDTMDSKTLDKLASLLLTGLNDARNYAGTKESIMNQDLYQIFEDSKTLIFVGSKGLSVLIKATNLLVNIPQIGRYASPEHIRREVETALFTLTNVDGVEIRSKSKEISQNLVDRLEQSIHYEWLCCEPIVNLTVKVPQLEIGRVLFTNPKSTAFADIIQRFILIMNDVSTPTEVKQYIKNYLTQRFQTDTISIVKVESMDRINAERISSDEIEHALNVMRFYSFSEYGYQRFGDRMHFGRGGYTFRSQNVKLCTKEDQVNFNVENTGYLMTYQIDENKIASMNDHNLLKVSEILTKPDRTEFENLLLNSIDFFGSGINEIAPKNTFTKFIMSLEVLLLKDREKKGLLSERVALIMGQNLKCRQEFFDITQQMYKIRSEIVHGGSQMVTSKDVNYIGSLVFNVIIRLIPLADSISNKGSLISILNKMKFGIRESFCDFVYTSLLAQDS